MSNYNNNPNRERENPTAEEQQKKAERENPKSIDVKTVEKNLTLGAGDSYLLHPGATEESERAKREYDAEKQAELERARASDRKPEQFRKSTSEVEVRALDVSESNKDDQQNKNSSKKSK